MVVSRIRRLFLTFVFALVGLGIAEKAVLGTDLWRAGFARVDITPEEPIFLLGYSTRKGPFESVETRIMAKAMALEDANGNRGVIVSTDLVGVQDPVFGSVCERIEMETGLKRNQILLNASHTHTGPLVSLNPVQKANIAYGEMSTEDASRTVAYTRSLQDLIVGLVKEALNDLSPAKISWGTGEVGFVMNRRVIEKDRVRMQPNPGGIRDSTVPVLKVDSPDGNLRGLLFGCACHNTTLTDKHNLICGDYAGFAQLILEDRYPGVAAHFLIGCGADANPEPRGEMEMAREHGLELAEEVESVAGGPLKPVRGLLRMGYEVEDLPLKELTKEDLEFIASSPSAEALMAKQILSIRESGGELPTAFPAPFAVWRFGSDLTLVGLPGEPVAEYVSLLKKDLGDPNLWVAGYNNHCFGYLPSRRIVDEGGHENIGVTLWIWGQDLSDRVGFFEPHTQDVTLRAVRRLWEQTTPPRN